MVECRCRDRCMVTTLAGGSKSKRLEQRIVERSRAELDIPCGFEMAGTVEGCPKRRRLRGETERGE